MIDVKEAVQKALLFVHEIMQDGRANDALLEEIDRSEDGHTWLVTISLPSPRTSGISSMLGPPTVEARDYKLIRVDSSTGEVESLKIRKV